MKKVALVFVLAVFVPSLVLAWLAVRSLRDQQFLIEKQQSLLYQGVADALAGNVLDTVSEHQRTFSLKVAALCSSGSNLMQQAPGFDVALRKEWPLAKVGFVVTEAGTLSCPSPYSSPEAQTFCTDNVRFLANRESVEVYWNPKQLANNGIGNNFANSPAQIKESPGISIDLNSAPINSSANNQVLSGQVLNAQNGAPQEKFAQQPVQQPALKNSGNEWNYDNKSRAGLLKGQQQRSVAPVQSS